MKRPALLLPVLLSALLLAACNDTPAPAAGTADAPTSGATAEGSPSAEAQAAAASAAAAEGATVSPAGDTTADATAPAAATAATADPAGPVEGVDYEVIRGGQPWEPLNGKIEVVEVFGYVCPACARLEPIFTAWESKLPADVRVSFVPAPFGPQWTPYAKAFYVADALGLVDETHTAMFHAIHIQDTLPGEGETPDEAAIAQWYGQHGADAKQFRAAMDSFATNAKVNRGRQFMVRSGVGGTPTIIVNGKYRVTGGRTYEEVLQITDQLISRERAAGASAAS